MNKVNCRFCLVVLVFVLCFNSLTAQNYDSDDENYETEEYIEEPFDEEAEPFWNEDSINSNPLIKSIGELEKLSSEKTLNRINTDSSKWREITGGETFLEEKEEQKENQYNDMEVEKHHSLPSINSGILKTIQILAIIALSVFVIIVAIRIINSNKGRNKTWENEDEFWQINLEESDAAESEISVKLKNAVESGNYSFAIRLHYLMVLNELNRKKLIHWKKDKTNADFIRELKNTNFKKELKSLTRWFELFWFGNRQADEAAYLLLKPRFLDFLKQIDQEQ